MSVKYWI